MNRRDEPPLLVTMPEPGFYKCRLIRGGPYVGAVIRREHPRWSADPVWSVEIDGKPAGTGADPWLIDGIQRVWTGIRIDEAEYRRLLARSPMPAGRPVNLLTMEPPF